MDDKIYTTIQMPFLEDVAKELKLLRDELNFMREKIQPVRVWYDMKEACELKGVNYNTISSNPKYQPNQGYPDKIICGRKRWRYETILEWIEQGDDEIPEKN